MKALFSARASLRFGDLGIHELTEMLLDNDELTDSRDLRLDISFYREHYWVQLDDMSLNSQHPTGLCRRGGMQQLSELLELSGLGMSRV